MARILLVDDEHDVVTLIQFMLEQDGHMVIAAYDGAKALARAGVEPRDETAVIPDLVILDVMMPVMDGYAVHARLREDERTKNVPVIVLTAKDEMKEQFTSACGMTLYLEKPFDPKKLRKLVASLRKTSGPQKS